MRRAWLTLPLVIAALAFPAGAQTDQFLPEIDTYYKFNSIFRAYFQVKQTREGGVPTTAEIGPSLDFYLKRLSKLIDISAFDRDDSKSQLLVFSFGYRILPYPSAPPANRFEPYVTLNIPAKGGLLISDKNRADLDWQSGHFSWHYRNRLNLERPAAVRGYHLSPYVSGEIWYTSQYAKWSTTSIFAGCLLPFGKRVDLNPYFEHQNNTGKTPNQHLNQLGLVLNLWF